MVGNVDVLSKYCDAVRTPNSASPVATKAKLKPELDSGSSGAVSPDPATARCRYKTGRCANARVVKPNGTLLLLCEFHRSQQNRTKKRSDMKYRQDRANKRMVERQQIVKPRIPTNPKNTSTSGSCKDTSTARHRRSCHQAVRPLSRPEELKALAGLFQRSDFSMPSPHKQLGDDSLFFASSFLRSSKSSQIDGCISLNSTTIHANVLEIDLEDADVTEDFFATRAASDVEATSSVLPFCMSPLNTSQRRCEVHWQPDDVHLLEYFIL